MEFLNRWHHFPCGHPERTVYVQDLHVSSARRFQRANQNLPSCVILFQRYCTTKLRGWWMGAASAMGSTMTVKSFRNSAASSLALCLLLAAAAFTQQSDSGKPQLKQPGTQQSKITVDVNTVNILATVRDRHGKIVSDLNKDAFQLEEDGKSQTIDFFARESDLPLRLALLVDTSLSQRNVLDQERTASQTFLSTMLRPDKDIAAIINFDFDITLLQDFTSSLPKLQAALQKLETPQLDMQNGQGTHQRGGGGYGHGRGGGTHLYDAIYLASDELMSKQQGRKALIVLSDGVDHGSKETLATAIETAQRADTVVYSILFADHEGYSRGFAMGGPYGGYGGHGGHGGRPSQQERPDGKKILEQISNLTGGRLFEVSKKETVDKIYLDIQEELRNQYRIGYTPAKNLEVGYHKIHLYTNNKDLKVQARDGYYSNSSSPSASR
jgi:VWFA-related protein